MNLPKPFYTAGVHIGIDLPGGQARFTTRRGGYSSGPYASLNLGRWTDDRPESVERNRAALAAALGVRLVSGRQVHGAAVQRLRTAPGERSTPVEADGQATASPGLAPMVLTADCLPIALGTEGVVAMLHAGWRGLAAGVVAEGVRAIRELGGSGPLAAAIGPGAGPCCYEVGDEVHAQFVRFGATARRGRNLDLKQVARSELEAEGVDAIHDAGLCTICSEPTLFFSHRRDRGLTGRQAGIAWLI
jgi:YfiH family protein